MSNKKIAAITVCSSGIGKVTAVERAKKGYEMLMREGDKLRHTPQFVRGVNGAYFKQMQQRPFLPIFNDHGLYINIWKKSASLFALPKLEIYI